MSYEIHGRERTPLRRCEVLALVSFMGRSVPPFYHRLFRARGVRLFALSFQLTFGRERTRQINKICLSGKVMPNRLSVFGDEQINVIKGVERLRVQTIPSNQTL